MSDRFPTLARALVLALAAPGCIDVQGGALESGWVINAAENGLRINCACARIERVRFALQPTAGGVDPCAADERCRFSCAAHTATTPFIVPEESYAIAVVALDAEGQDLGAAQGVVAPAPTSRSVRGGELTSLGVSLLTVALDRLAGPSACEPEWLRPPL